jgi:4-amino-4-deoxy-L-arabinose transferase-like glycosyltransferase
MSWSALLERRWFPLVLMLVWALAYLPNLGLRTLRLEEGRRATPAREMIASGDFVRPTLYGDTYLNKPPLYFWLVAATASLLGEVDPLATRLPAVLSALGCALIALRFGRDVLDRRTRSLAAIFVLSATTMLDKGTLGEIDATLCFLVAAVLSCWWNAKGVAALFRWVMVGLLLGAAGLLKGPAGAMIFYLAVGPYLLWQRRIRELLSPGHLLCVVLQLLPAGLWVWALLDRNVISLEELWLTWTHQLGTHNAVGSVVSPAERTTQLVSHYTSFPPQVFAMLFPAVLWLPFGIRRGWSALHGLPEDLRRLLVCGLVGPVLVFFLYPESRPRHLMPAFFAACVLSAMVVGATCRVPRARILQHRVGLALAFVPAIVGLLGVGLTAWDNPSNLVVAILALAVGIVWTALAMRLTTQTETTEGTLTLAVNLAGATLAVWFAINAVVVPWSAPRSTLSGAVEISSRLPPDEPLYTTRTFPGKGEGNYNAQFHLARDVRSADVEMLKQLAPCHAVVTPDEQAQLVEEGWSVNELGRVFSGPREVRVIRVTKVSGAP